MDLKNKRQEMVRVIKEDYGLDSPRVLSVMLQVPREKFVSDSQKHLAYLDNPVSIRHGQTMSQPYTVAFMTDLLVRNKDKVRKNLNEWKILEIGTGSGYQAAVLSKLVKEVYTIEIVLALARRADKLLKSFQVNNVHVKTGSGEYGWKEKAPFDAIVITAGVEDEAPKELFDQLKLGGVLVAPVGKGVDKKMTKYIKISKSKFSKSEHGVFHFVPFVK